MRTILNKISDSKGLSLLEVLVGVGMLMAVMTASLIALQALLERQRAGDLTLGVMKYQITLVSSLQSSDALSKTAAANGVNCLMTRQKCAVGATNFASLSVFDHQGNLLSDGVNANVGFNKEGLVCTTFPSRMCPYRYAVEWRAYCVGGQDCDSPLFQARGALQVADDIRAFMNSSKFSFFINLGQIMGTYEQACTSMGGTYVAADPPQCAMSLNGPCPTMAGSRQVVYAFDKAAGTKQCRPLFWDVACGPNEILFGIDDNGVPACRTMKFVCADGTMVTDMNNCPATAPISPLDCQVNPPCPDLSGGVSVGGDGGCGGDSAGDGCP